MSIKSNKFRLFIVLLFIFYKFSTNTFFFNTFDKQKLTVLNKKKNIFFKKKILTKILVSRRLSIVLRKRKVKGLKQKKVEHGNFFFKKFFFKTLLKSRSGLKKFFFLNKKVRQKKITKNIYKNTSNLTDVNSIYEYNLLNVLLRAHFFFFKQDAALFIKKRFVFINGKQFDNTNIVLCTGDCVQLKISTIFFKYLLSCKKIFKKKITIFRFNSWKFFEQKFSKKTIKIKKRKTPKFLFLFFLFKMDVFKFLEVDFFTLSVVLLKKQKQFTQPTYYLNKPFSIKLFNLYNFKKIN